MLWFLALSALCNLIFGFLWISAANAREDAEHATKCAIDSVGYWREKHITRESFRKGL